jgi:asparagine synthase (glutamine-hydrolysing)
MGSLEEGAYFLNRGLFLPEELPALMRADIAWEGLARLAGSPPCMTRADARVGIAAVGLLKSTLYLRNQLLRDSDWASAVSQHGDKQAYCPYVSSLLSARL